MTDTPRGSALPEDSHRGEGAQRPPQRFSPPPMSQGESQWAVGYFESLHGRLDRDSDRVDKRLDQLNELVGEVKTLADEIKGGLKTLRLVLVGVGILATLILLAVRFLKSDSFAERLANPPVRIVLPLLLKPF